MDDAPGGAVHEGVPGALQEAHHLPGAVGCAWGVTVWLAGSWCRGGSRSAGWQGGLPARAPPHFAAWVCFVPLQSTDSEPKQAS